jgi:hypothetical protein
VPTSVAVSLWSWKYVWGRKGCLNL